jgi:hypothetical protein
MFLFTGSVFHDSAEELQGGAVRVNKYSESSSRKEKKKAFGII